VIAPRSKKIVFEHPPPLLFKYVGHWAQSFFKDPFLRFSSPLLFNDPFEFFPIIKFRGAKYAREYLRAHNRLSAQLTSREGAIELSRRFQKAVANEFAVLCMSASPDNILMWGHYGASHEGCAFGFDSDLIRAFSIEGQAHKAGRVVYGERPVIPYPQQDVINENLSILFSKAKEWSYEDEWRIAIRRDFKPGILHLDLKFPAECLRWVIIGCRAGVAERKNAYLAALRKNTAFNHVQAFFSERHPEGYRLQFKNETGRVIDWREQMAGFAERKVKSPKAPFYRPAEEYIAAALSAKAQSRTGSLS
jgi:hypothetical protein